MKSKQQDIPVPGTESASGNAGPTGQAAIDLPATAAGDSGPGAQAAGTAGATAASDPVPEGQADGNVPEAVSDAAAGKAHREAGGGPVPAAADGAAPDRPEGAESVAQAPRFQARLRSLPLLRGVPDDAKTALLAAMQVRTTPAGNALRDAGREAGVVLLRGRATRAIPWNQRGEELWLELFEPYDVLAEGCLLRGRTSFPGRIVAIEETVAAYIPRPVLRNFLQEHPGAAEHMFESFSNRLARASALLAQNSFMRAEDRIYCRLVELNETRGKQDGEHWIHHGLTQNELACFAGLSREIVNRKLSAWREAGWIELQARKLRIINEKALTESVSPEARRVGFGVGDGRFPLHP